MGGEHRSSKVTGSYVDLLACHKADREHSGACLLIGHWLSDVSRNSANALKFYLKASQLDPMLSEAGYCVADTYLKVKGSSPSSSASSAAAATNLTGAESCSNDIAEALQLIDSMASSRADWTHCLRGHLLRAKGDFRGAVDSLQRYLEAESDDTR